MPILFNVRLALTIATGVTILGGWLYIGMLKSQIEKKTSKKLLRPLLFRLLSIPQIRTRRLLLWLMPSIKDAIAAQPSSDVASRICLPESGTGARASGYSC